MSYESLHKFLLPNHSINDVLLDMAKLTTKSALKTEEEKQKTESFIKTEVVPTSAVLSETKEIPSPPKDDIPTEIKPELPRKQKRLQERLKTKVEEKEKRDLQRKAMSTSFFKQSLEKIKSEVKQEKLRNSLNLSIEDEQRIKIVLFGKNRGKTS